jgi:predicted small lipoprotein YifL
VSLRAVSAMAAVAIALAGCGTENPQDKPPVDKPAPPAPPPERTPFGRRDAPPVGIAEQLSYFATGDTTCPLAPDYSGKPAIWFADDNHVEVGERFFDLCLLRFDPDRPIVMLVRRPDGREVLQRVPPEPYEPTRHPIPHDTPVRYWSWDTFPGDPLGRYTVIASQGTTEAKASFQLHRASTPKLRVIPSDSSVASGKPGGITLAEFSRPYSSVAPGKPVRIALAGFRPRERVRVHMYEDEGTNSSGPSYLTSITVQVDDEGEAIHEIASDVGDPPGEYVLDIGSRRQRIDRNGRSIKGVPGQTEEMWAKQTRESFRLVEPKKTRVHSFINVRESPLKIRPRTIGVSGSGGISYTRLRWTIWGDQLAEATGRVCSGRAGTCQAIRIQLSDREYTDSGPVFRCLRPLQREEVPMCLP